MMGVQYTFDLDQIFSKPGPLTVAYGMGTDSTALLIELVKRGIRPDLITFAETGSEHPRTYAYLPIINAYLLDHGFPTITIVQYVPKRFKNGPYDTLAGNCLANKTLPSLAFGRKSCSIKWKARPQEKYILKYWPPGMEALKTKTPIRRLIGYDAGPKDSQRGAIIPNPKFYYAYPLQFWGIDRQGSEDIIKEAGLPQPGKSSCYFCPSFKPNELKQLALEFPDLAARAIALEDGARPNLKVIKGLWRKGTKKRPGSWRAYLEAFGLLPEIRPEHYSATPSPLPPSSYKAAIYPGLMVYDHTTDPLFYGKQTMPALEGILV